MRSVPTRVIPLVSALGLAVALPACSDIIQDVSPFSEKQARCDLRPVDSQCTDVRKFKGPTLATFQGVCGSLTSAKKGATGYQEEATCDSVASLGGCQSTSSDGSVQTNWYYAGDKYKTADDTKKECSGGQSWVAPAP